MEEVDLSHNPISHLAGKMLSEYVGVNTQIVQLQLNDTLINPALIRIIERKAAANAKFKSSSQTSPDLESAVVGNNNNTKERNVLSKTAPAAPIPTAVVKGDTAATIPEEAEQVESNTVDSGNINSQNHPQREIAAPAATPIPVSDKKPYEQPPVEQKEETPQCYLTIVFNLCEREDFDYKNLRLLSQVASVDYPVIKESQFYKNSISQQIKNNGDEHNIEEARREQQAVSDVMSNDEWYGVKLLYSTSHIDESTTNSWHGIKSIFTAAMEEEAQKREKSDSQVAFDFTPAAMQQRQPSPSSQVSRKISVHMDSGSGRINAIELLVALSPPLSDDVKILNFLMECSRPVEVVSLPNLTSLNSSDPVLEFLLSIPQFAAECSTSVVSPPMGSIISVAHPQYQSLETSKSPEGWYAMDLVWKIVQSKSECPESDQNWGALASVMSIIRKG